MEGDRRARFLRPSHFKPDGKKPGGKPYFFQAVINPASDEVLLNANYKTECPADYEPNYDLTQKPGAIGPGFDSLSTGRLHPRQASRA